MIPSALQNKSESSMTRESVRLILTKDLNISFVVKYRDLSSFTIQRLHMTMLWEAQQKYITRSLHQTVTSPGFLSLIHISVKEKKLALIVHQKNFRRDAI